MTLFDDPSRRASIDALFDVVWPRMTERIDLAARLGADWHAVSTPFARFEGDRAVAHVGVIEIPMVLAGVPTVVAGVHAVGCDPEYRHRGHIKALLAEALAHVERRGLVTAQLTTSSPGVFSSAGFRIVKQTAFDVRLPAERKHDLRPLAAEIPSDVALVHRLCRSRTPLSRRLGVIEPGWLLLIDEVLTSHGLARLHYAEELDAILAFGVSTLGDLEVLDIVAAELPSLDEVLRRLPAGFDRATLFFTPDRFDAAVTARPAWPDLCLMARGPYPEGASLVLPELAHC